MRIPAIIFLLIFLPTFAFSQQALVERGFAEFYLSGAGGKGNNTALYGGEFGIGLNGDAALSVAYAGVDHVSPRWHSTTVVPMLTFAFHTKNDRQQSILALHIGIATGKRHEYSGYQGRSFNLGMSGWAKKPINSKVTFVPGAGMTIAKPLGDDRDSGLAVGFGATAGFRFDWFFHSYGFIIPGFSFAGDLKVFTLEAGIGLKGKFTPQPRREGR